jgi:hypothetical protein
MTSPKKKKQAPTDGVFVAAAKTVGAFAGKIAAAVGVTATADDPKPRKAALPKPRKTAVPNPRKAASPKPVKKAAPKRPMKATRKAPRKAR